VAAVKGMVVQWSALSNKLSPREVIKALRRLKDGALSFACLLITNDNIHWIDRQVAIDIKINSGRNVQSRVPIPREFKMLLSEELR
jgi:hypothetical protein